MYETLRITSRLVYIVQLHFEGLKDAGTSMAPSKLIEHLQRRREAWSSPNTTEKRGYVAIAMKYHSRAYELAGGAFAGTDGQHFEIVSLPTSSNDECRTPRGIEPGIPIGDFIKDPTQDVVAFLEDVAK
jgi:hypothetical protein